MKKLIIIFFLTFLLCIFNCNKRSSPPVEPISITTLTPTNTFINSLTPTNTSSQTLSATYTTTIKLTFTNTSTPTESSTLTPSPTTTSTSTETSTLTNTFTITPTATNTIPIIYLTATIQCTCFVVRICDSSPYYYPIGPIAQDQIGAICVSSGITCAYVKRYDPTNGALLSSDTAYLVYGLEPDPSGSKYYTTTWINDAQNIQFFPTFNKTISSSGNSTFHYRGLAYDGTNWWTVFAKGWADSYSETKLQKFSPSGELLASFDAPYLEKTYGTGFIGSCWDFSYYNGYLWLINNNLLFKVSPITGQVLTIYNLGSWSFKGVSIWKWGSFWAAEYNADPPSTSISRICNCNVTLY